MRKKTLKAGPLNLVYENGFLRYIRLGDQEVIRMINHSLRDQNWGTVPMEMVNEDLDIKEDHFHINYQACFRRHDIAFDLHCEISGNKKGEITFVYMGWSRSNFLKNRIGFTLLHPISECVGKPLTLIHTNNKVSKATFPSWISPHQPFKDIKEMHWELKDGNKASVFFDGDVFETEDQRNWTDASFKTYCTPLELPFPVQVKMGEKIQQRIRLKVHAPAATENTEALPIKITLRHKLLAVPHLGSEIHQPLNREQLTQEAAALGLSYLRVNLELDKNYDQTLDLLEKLMPMKIHIELALFTDQKSAYLSLSPHQDLFGSVTKLLLFGNSSKTTPNHLIAEIHEWKELLPHAAVYAGTDAFFTELNRNKVDAEQIEGVTYSINPQVHAFDNASLVETLEAQAYTVHTARYLYPGKKINISPVSFHMRWNPNATDPGKDLREPALKIDERQHQFFGACWFLFSFKYLTEAGADAVTYFDFEGDRGWFKQQNKSRSSMYLLRKEIHGFKSLQPCKSSAPLKVDVVIFEKDGRSIMLMVNWTGEEQKVELPEKYQPEKYCQGLNEDQDRLAWQPSKAIYSEKIVFLPAASLTWFEKKQQVNGTLIS